MRASRGSREALSGSASRRRGAVGLGLLLAAALAFGADVPFETPPIVLSAAEILPAELVEGENHKVDDRVENDGYMNHYEISSKYGEFTAEGNAALRVRVAEIDAIAQLTEITRSEAFADAVKLSATNQYRAAKNVVEHPKETAKGLPGGVKRFVKRTKRKVEDLHDDAKEEYAEYKEEKAEKKAAEAEKQEKIDSGELPPEETKSTTEQAEEFWEDDGKELAKKGAEAGETYALDWIGYARARIRYARELGVDPYTDNPVLNKQLNRVSQAATAGGLTMRLVPVPHFEVLSYMKDANQLVWKMDPLDLRMHNEELLYAMGVSEEAVEALYDNKHQSPSLITFMVTSLVALEGVDGRTSWIELAREVGSHVEASYLVRAINFLAEYHERRSKLEKIVVSENYPRARTVNDRVVIAVPMDFVHWTEDLAVLVASQTESLRARERAEAIEAWVEGEVSDAARRGLESHGFEVHPRSFFGLKVDFAEGGGA